MRNYYIYYDNTADINYNFLFCLHKIADINGSDRLYNTINYIKLSSLSTKIKEVCGYSIAPSTISKIFQNQDNYINYFSICKATKVITLHNNFRKANQQSRFVILNDTEINFLISKADNLLNKYYLYLKYYCGFSKTKSTDTTASQFLSAIGYQESNNTKSKMSGFNAILQSSGFIQISSTRDTMGHKRNIYKVVYH